MMKLILIAVALICLAELVDAKRAKKEGGKDGGKDGGKKEGGGEQGLGALKDCVKLCMNNNTETDSDTSSDADSKVEFFIGCVSSCRQELSGRPAKDGKKNGGAMHEAARQCMDSCVTECPEGDEGMDCMKICATTCKPDKHPKGEKTARGGKVSKAVEWLAKGVKHVKGSRTAAEGWKAANGKRQERGHQQKSGEHQKKHRKGSE